MAGLVRGNFKTVIRLYSSALYITGDKAQTNFVVLTPHIDFDEQIKNKDDLVKSIQARKLSIDLDKIEKRWNFFKVLDDHRQVLEFTRTEIYSLISKLTKDDAEKNKSDIEKLLLHVKMVKDDLKNIKDYSYGIEENANLGVLSLPNLLHPKTPLNQDKIIHEHLTKPKIIDKGHLEIGKSQNLIEYTNPIFCFLKSDAALFEFALTNYFHSQLLKLGLVQFSNSDFARSVAVEGCGANHEDRSKIFTLENPNDELNRLHLVGGGSVCSFMAYFAKHQIQQSLLPLKIFSIGRKYVPSVEGRNLFDLSQSSVAQIFAATEDDGEKMDEILTSFTQEFIRVYESLGYHFRVVYVPPGDLETGASLKVSFQMFSNFLNKYVEVGSLSVYDTYISKRLLFTYSVNKERKFLRVISGEAVNVQKFLACAIENNYECKKPLLSNLLQKYL